MKTKMFIGIDVGGTKIAGAVVDAKGKILSREKESTPQKASPKEILEVIEEVIESLLDENDLTPSQISAIGLGIPGLVDPRNRILATPNINLAGFPLAAKLEKKFKRKVSLGNDVNLGLLAEKWLGAARKFNNVVGLFPGTGIGGAVILNGELFIGPHGAAAELGHMIIDMQGPKCTCGNRGCLEAIASRWAIERDIRSELKSGKKSLIRKLIKKSSVIKSKSLKECLKAKDPLVTRTMQRSSAVLGQACVSVRHIFNPELIILGGGVMEACGDFILPVVNKAMKADPFFSKFDKCRVVRSELQDDAVILGAVALAKKTLS